MAWSNRTAWSLVSSLSTTSVATGHCALLSYPFTLTTATTTSTTSSSFHQSSTMILMIVLICVGVFTSCSLYRVYGGGYQAHRVVVLQDEHYQTAAARDLGTDGTAVACAAGR
eukprot:gene8993-6460_t